MAAVRSQGINERRGEGGRRRDPPGGREGREGEEGGRPLPSHRVKENRRKAPRGASKSAQIAFSGDFFLQIGKKKMIKT